MKREQLSDDELRELLMQRKIRSREARPRVTPVIGAKS